MRTLLTLCVLLTLSACPKNQEGNDDSPGKLMLVEAELAARLLAGKTAVDAFCEAEIPHLSLDGSALAFHCGQVTERHKIIEDRVVGSKRTLKSEKGPSFAFERKGPERFRVTGSPCDGKPKEYVIFEDASRYREEWLKGAACPTEDMKLAQ